MYVQVKGKWTGEREGGRTVLEILIRMKKKKGTRTFRRSCREGICGSCAMNINGRNTLACIKKIGKEKRLRIEPLPSQRVIKDLVTDMTLFYSQLKGLRPRKKKESAEEGRKCVLCACCTTSCPSYWWNSKTYIGPAVLLQAIGWWEERRQKKWNRSIEILRCQNIQNCKYSCPKKLEPDRLIRSLRWD